VIPFSREHVSLDLVVITARLTANEAAMLGTLAGQLIDLLAERSIEAGSGESSDASDALYAQLGIGGASARPLDPALARLLPDAYRDDAEAASDHRRLTERGLVDRKVSNARAVIATLESATTSTFGTVRRLSLDEHGVQAWLRTLTDLRLTIAARLQIEEDGDEGVGDEAMLAVYDWLGYLQGTLIATIDPASASGPT
jgi:hypothetical protein